MKTIFRRLFRVYAHIYYSHLRKIVANGKEKELNRCFKHLVLFVHEFHLMSPTDMEPLAELIATLCTPFASSFLIYYSSQSFN